jgi:hypothetical protein
MGYAAVSFLGITGSSWIENGGQGTRKRKVAQRVLFPRLAGAQEL